MCLTGILLDKLDFLWWDFEMSHEYKLRLGAKNVARAEWIPEYHRCRSDVRKLECAQSSAKDLLMTKKRPVKEPVVKPVVAIEVANEEKVTEKMVTEVTNSS